MRIFGKGKCKLIANCANFGKGKCKFIANFSATMVTSLPSLSLSLSVCISLSLSPKVPHAQYRKRFRASYNLGFRSLVARLVPFERGGTKPEGENIFGNGKCELIANFSANHGDLSSKGETSTGSVKGETKSANFWQGKV